ncbi:MAG: hypothetical protein AB7T63_06595 [Planctomycetota bacterium]
MADAPDARVTGTYDLLIRRAQGEVRAHDLVRAEATAREALAVLPERAAAYNILALVRELQGRHSEAMDLLRAGLAVEPTYAPAQENLTRLGRHPRQGRMVIGDESD